MSILVNKDSRIVVQGITGSEGTFHSNQMIDYGTNIVAGVTPGKGGQTALESKVPVFDCVEDAMKTTDANVSIIFVPPPFAADAIIEAPESGIDLIVCITEGVPIHDMVKAKNIIDRNSSIPCEKSSVFSTYTSKPPCLDQPDLAIKCFAPPNSK